VSHDGHGSGERDCLSYGPPTRILDSGNKVPPVCAENLDSAIQVMKPSENRSGCDGTDALDRPMEGSIMAQCAMGPRTIVVDGIRVEDPAQMAFPEHDQVVDALPSDRAD
jgi:hypothetical protein